jgi:hypothetical protein
VPTTVVVAKPCEVSFELEGGSKVTLAIRGHVVDGLHDAEENEKEMSEVFRAALDEGWGERV